MAAAKAVLQTNNGMLVATGNTPYSLRTLKSNWASGAKRKPGDGASENEESIKATQVENASEEAALLKEYRKNGSRVFIFVLGGLFFAKLGMTFSEMRSCYEVMREYRREVVIGSTHVSNPRCAAH